MLNSGLVGQSLTGKVRLSVLVLSIRLTESYEKETSSPGDLGSPMGALLRTA